MINNIFGLGSNGVRERAWKRILSGHLDVSTLKYASTSLKIFSYLPVNAQDIDRAIREMLPVITWEAYFAAEMLGLSNKKMDEREKKRNFEATRNPWITAPNGYTITFPEFAELPQNLGRMGSRFWGTPCSPLSLLCICANKWTSTLTGRRSGVIFFSP